MKTAKALMGVDQCKFIFNVIPFILFDRYPAFITVTMYVALFQIFIDRDPTLFAIILNFLRTKELDLRYIVVYCCILLKSKYM